MNNEVQFEYLYVVLIIRLRKVAAPPSRPARQQSWRELRLKHSCPDLDLYQEQERASRESRKEAQNNDKQGDKKKLQADVIFSWDNDELHI